MKKKKVPRFPDFEIVEIPSHILDSIYIKNDGTELKIIFATGQILSFKPLEENEISN